MQFGGGIVSHVKRSSFAVNPDLSAFEIPDQDPRIVHQTRSSCLSFCDSGALRVVLLETQFGGGSLLTCEAKSLCSEP